MSGVAAGKLRHRVEIQKPSTAQDPVTGEMLVTWTKVAEVWAAVRPLSAREFMSAGAEQSEVQGVIEIRYRSDVDATMRVVHRGQWHAIHGVKPDAESGLEHLTLMVGEGVRLDR